MKKIFQYLILLLSICLYSCSTDNDLDPTLKNPHTGIFNLDFEARADNYPSHPKNWGSWGDGYRFSLDSLEKYSGKLSLKVEKPGNRNDNFGAFSNSLPIEVFAGKNLEFKGWIKTKEVKNGYAGLWFRVDGEKGTLGFDNMSARGLKGDNNWTQVSIKMDISSNATYIVFGGIFPGEGTVWFDRFELFINGEKYIDPEPKTSLSKEEMAVLKQYIYPLRTFEPDGGDTKDLKVLDNLIANSSVVALGEVTHGSSEIFKMKNRIIQYLAVNNGFDIFSIEAAMPESYKLNDYTVRGEGDPKKLIAGMYFWTWRTEEVLNMVEWMRRFNQPKQRIAFTGFDMQAYDGALNELSGAFKEREDVINKIADLKKILDDIKQRQQSSSSGYATVSYIERDYLDSLFEFLKKNIEISAFQAAEKNWLLQNIVVIQQCLQNYQSNTIPWRDKCMADNLMWIKEHNPGSKIVTWAHNGHIMKTDQMMGYHLAKMLGDDHVTFGFTFSEGSYTAAGNKGLTSYPAVKAYPGTLEFFLEQLNEPIFILDIKKIISDNHKDTKWLKERLPYRRVGALGGQASEFGIRKVVDDFDYLIYIKKSNRF